MFELEKAIIDWRKRMEASPSLEPGQIAELESHLRDKIDDLTARGRTAEQAFEEAVRTLGETGLIGSQFFKVYTPRRSGRPSWQAPRFVPALAWNYIRIALRKIRRQKGYSLITIAGLAGQTFKDFECIFVDNRYEKRRDRVDQIARKHGLHLIHAPEHRRNGHWMVSCEAFNTGFALARGKYVMLLPDYTYAPPDWIESVLNVLSEHPRRVVATPYDFVELPDLADPSVEVGDAEGEPAIER